MQKPLKVAAYSGLFIMILSAIFSFVLGFFVTQGIIYKILSIIFMVGFFGLDIIFTYGFIILGKKFNNKFLVVVSWISITISILLLLFSTFGYLFFQIPGVSAQTNLTLPSNESLMGAAVIRNLIISFLMIFIIFSIIFGIFSILFGIGLLAISKDVKYAKAAGILNIISGATYVIFIGYLVAVAAYIVEIILMFRASKDFEPQT